MSPRRLVVTGAVMAATALLLSWLAPDLPAMVDAVADAQGTVDAAGADVLLAAVAGLAAWGVWAWGALGLALTAVAVLPGAAGATAGSVLRGLWPAGARRGAALALGVGLGLAVPVLLVPHVGGVRTVLAAEPSTPVAPDWPLDGGAGVPDWPTGDDPPHVVVRGDCLWDIAARWLSASGSHPTDAAVAAAVQAWWSVNAAVIGPDPDLILPGQVLRPPQS